MGTAILELLFFIVSFYSWISNDLIHVFPGSSACQVDIDILLRIPFGNITVDRMDSLHNATLFFRNILAVHGFYSTSIFLAFRIDYSIHFSGSTVIHTSQSKPE